MSQRREAALKGLQKEDSSRRFLRLRMTLALIIFLINAFVWIPVMALFLILVFSFFSEGATFVQEIISTKGTALEGTLSRGGYYFFGIISLILGWGLALIIGYWVVVKASLLSGDQVWELNWRLGRGGIFGLFEKESEKPSRHEIKN